MPGPQRGGPLSSGPNTGRNLGANSARHRLAGVDPGTLWLGDEELLNSATLLNARTVLNQYLLTATGQGTASLSAAMGDSLVGSGKGQASGSVSLLNSSIIASATGQGSGSITVIDAGLGVMAAVGQGAGAASIDVGVTASGAGQATGTVSVLDAGLSGSGAGQGAGAGSIDVGVTGAGAGQGSGTASANVGLSGAGGGQATGDGGSLDAGLTASGGGQGGGTAILTGGGVIPYDLGSLSGGGQASASAFLTVNPAPDDGGDGDDDTNVGGRAHIQRPGLRYYTPPGWDQLALRGLKDVGNMQPIEILEEIGLTPIFAELEYVPVIDGDDEIDEEMLMLLGVL